MYCFDYDYDYYRKKSLDRNQSKPNNRSNHLPSNDFLRRELKKFYFDFDTKNKHFMSSKKRELVSYFFF